MLKSLFRLRPFIEPYRWRLGAGIVAFGIARLALLGWLIAQIFQGVIVENKYYIDAYRAPLDSREFERAVLSA